MELEKKKDIALSQRSYLDIDKEWHSVGEKVMTSVSYLIVFLLPPTGSTSLLLWTWDISYSNSLDHCWCIKLDKSRNAGSHFPEITKQEPFSSLGKERNKIYLALILISPWVFKVCKKHIYCLRHISSYLCCLYVKQNKDTANNNSKARYNRMQIKANHVISY